MESKITRFDEVNYDLKILRNDYETLKNKSQQISEEMSKQSFAHDKLLMNYGVCMFELDRMFVSKNGDIKKIDRMDLGNSI